MIFVLRLSLLGSLKITPIESGATDTDSSTVDQSISHESSSIIPGSNSDTIPQVDLSKQEDQSSLDIPAFLRQQAD